MEIKQYIYLSDIHMYSNNGLDPTGMNTSTEMSLSLPQKWKKKMVHPSYQAIRYSGSKAQRRNNTMHCSLWYANQQTVIFKA